MFFDRKEQRREIVEENFEAREKRTDEDQLPLLDIKLGKDQGARRERIRLLKKIKKRKNEKLHNKTK